MEIKKMGVATPQAPKTLGAKSEAGGPQDQVSMGQTPQDQAISVMQQMAQARVELGHQLISNVLEPAPKEFQEVSQATMPHREEVAQYLAGAAEGTETPSPQGVLTSAFYVLATETKTLAQAAVNTENRAKFQTEHGVAVPNRDEIFQQELGYLVEANIYQGQIPAEQLQGILQVQPEGEMLLSAGAFVQEVRKYVPAESAAQITEVASQNPLMLAFHDNPELRQRFVGALEQNAVASAVVNEGCMQYFGVLNAIIQKDMEAQQVLIQAQQS